MTIHEKYLLIEKALSQFPAVISILNKNGELVYWNKEFERVCDMYNFHKKKRNAQFFEEEQQQEQQEKEVKKVESFYSKIRERGAERCEVSFWTTEKNTKTYALIGSVMHDEYDEVYGYSVVLRNITAYRLDETKLSKFNEQLEEQIRNATQELVIANKKLRKKIEETEILNEQLETTNALLKENSKLFIHGPVIVFKWLNQEWRPCEYVSPNVEENLGYKSEEFRNQWLFWQIIHPNDIDRVRQESQHSKDQKKTNHTHKAYRIRKKSWEYIRVLDYTTISWDKDGKIEHFIWYLVDLSEKNP